eukprot:TRINITY_DN2081_c0_g2_i2.p1 TRINITY_DN2081_c0_g2~~TRINITY_DN2081_c0_g2_i2.p1  ORF type:complete len:149 (-),score=5.68 TRINITY_DN2081_c0_g2_i2:81-527(-)
MPEKDRPIFVTKGIGDAALALIILGWMFLPILFGALVCFIISRTCERPPEAEVLKSPTTAIVASTIPEVRPIVSSKSVVEPIPARASSARLSLPTVTINVASRLREKVNQLPPISNEIPSQYPEVRDEVLPPPNQVITDLGQTFQING